MIPGIVAGGRRGAPPVPAAVYWNPLKKHPNISLSGDGRTALGSGSTWQSVFAVQGRSAGKRYFETFVDINGDWAMFHGIGIAALALNNFVGSGAGGFGVGYRPGFGDFHGGAGAPGLGVIPVGSYMRWAVDLDAGRLWVGSATAWSRGGSPAAGTTPTVTFTPGTELFPIASLYSPATKCTLRVAPADMAGMVPAGFLAWSV